MNEQTAIEWLFAHLLPFLEFSDPKEREHFRKCLTEAKAMEKEQIMNAYLEGESDADHSNDSALLYYKETYGGDE